MKEEEGFAKGKFHLLLIQILKKHKSLVEQVFQEKDLTYGQPKILHFLANNDGCIQKELAKNCHIKPATVTNLLHLMEKSGLIERKKSPTDKRVLNVYLTDKGRAAYEESKKVFEEMETVCFEGFTKEEMTAFVDYCKRIENNLKRKEEEND